MAIIYTLYGHDRGPIGQRMLETRLAIGEEIVHDERRYLVVAEPPPQGATFIDPLFSGYALESEEKPYATSAAPDGSQLSGDAETGGPLSA